MTRGAWHVRRCSRPSSPEGGAAPLSVVSPSGNMVGDQPLPSHVAEPRERSMTSSLSSDVSTDPRLVSRALLQRAENQWVR